MFQRVLVAVDLSDGSLAAIDQGKHYAKREGARLGVVHVVPNLVPVRPLFPQLGMEGAFDAAGLEQRAADAVGAHVAERTGLSPDAFDVLIESGGEASGVVLAADRWKADLLVVGSHGRSGFRRALLGSTAESVVRAAHCTVLVARGTPTIDGPVVAATDASDPSIAALRVAEIEARARGTRLVALHAHHVPIDPVAYGYLSPFGVSTVPPDAVALAALRSAAEAALSAAVDAAKVSAERVVVDGRASPVVVDYADRVKAALVVVSTHGHTGLLRLAMGSTAESIVRHASEPVMVVRATA